MTTTPQTADRRTARRGFTLTELMVVTTLIGVMAAMSVPSFQRAVEQSRVDIAVANLRAVWAAERLYWLENHTLYLQHQHPARHGRAGQLPSRMTAVSSIGGYQYSILAARPRHAADDNGHVRQRTGLFDHRRHRIGR